MTDKTKATGTGRLSKPLPRPAVNPPPRVRVVPSSASERAQSDLAAQGPQSKASSVKWRIKLASARTEKRKPSGDYAVGFARPPEHTRFKPNNPGGPGRRKGSRSQDAIMRKELDAKKTVRIDGRTVKMSHRELAAKLVVKKALEKEDPKLLLQLLSFSSLLFPEIGQADPAASAASIRVRDQQILQELFAGLAMGEPDPNNADPLANFGAPLPDLTGNPTSEDAGNAAAKPDRGHTLDEEAKDDV